MNIADGLLPCPFCGSKDIVENGYIRDGKKVWCKCGASVHAYEPNANEKARSIWNRRTNPTKEESQPESESE